MKKATFFSMTLTGAMALSLLAGCGSTTSSSETSSSASSVSKAASSSDSSDSSKNVLKVGMECAYAPF